MNRHGQCMRTGCERPATVAVQLCVPATGYPRDVSPVKIMLGLKLCRDHCAEEDAVRMATEIPPGFDGIDGKAPIQHVVETITKNRKVPPDFKRAYIVGVRLDSQEWADYERLTADEPKAKPWPSTFPAQ